MSCYRPRPCWYPVDGSRPIFREPVHDFEGFVRGFIDCGECIGCQRKYSSEWAIRLTHEARCHAENQFLTLTYRDEDRDPRGNLQPDHLRKFIKSLRNAYRGKKIRYYGVGEYGSRTWREHFHVCLFGHAFDDLEQAGKSPSGHPRFTSKALDALWGRGNTMIGNLDAGSASYTAGYCIKKLKDQSDRSAYKRLDGRTGEWYYLTPEFSQKSTHPGIGRLFFDRYWSDVFPGGECVILTNTGSYTAPAPGYYLRLLRQENEALYLDIKERRRLASEAHVVDVQPLRLGVREQVAQARQDLKKRDTV